MVSVADVEIGEKPLTAELDKARAFAEGTHCRIRLEHDPFIDSAASVKCEPPLQLRAEDFETVCTARSRKRDRLPHVQRIVHKIKVLTAGFEV